MGCETAGGYKRPVLPRRTRFAAAILCALAETALRLKK
jgi:hypothetical protein